LFVAGWIHPRGNARGFVGRIIYKGSLDYTSNSLDQRNVVHC